MTLGLTLVLYVLLRPVSRNLALLAVLFRLMSTALFAVAEMFYFAPSLILGGANSLKTFSSDQLSSLRCHRSICMDTARGYSWCFTESHPFCLGI